MKKTKTMREIATDLGLSQTTVSMCLSGRAEEFKIKSETETRVKDYTQKIGYIPNAAARNLAMNSSPDKVALLMSQTSGSERSMAALDLAIKTLEQAGKECLIRDCLPNTFTSALRSMKGEGAKDVILLGPFNNGQKEWEDQRADLDAQPALLHDINMYIIDDCFLGRPLFKKHVYRLGVDRKKVYFDLFDRIKNRLNEEIACGQGCLPPEEFSTYCKANYSSFDPAQHLSLNVDKNNLFDRGRDLTDSVCALMERSSVKFVFLHDDRVATGLIDGLSRRGVRVPDDVSVIGFDNIDAAPYFTVPLTTISLPNERHIRLVLSKILNGGELPKTVKSEAEIIWRKSSKRF